jgi:hypothetical protein
MSDQALPQICASKTLPRGFAGDLVVQALQSSRGCSLSQDGHEEKRGGEAQQKGQKRADHGGALA